MPDRSRVTPQGCLTPKLSSPGRSATDGSPKRNAVAHHSACQVHEPLRALHAPGRGPNRRSRQRTNTPPVRAIARPSVLLTCRRGSRTQPSPRDKPTFRAMRRRPALPRGTSRPALPRGTSRPARPRGASRPARTQGERPDRTAQADRLDRTARSDDSTARRNPTSPATQCNAPAPTARHETTRPLAGPQGLPASDLAESAQRPATAP